MTIGQFMDLFNLFCWTVIRLFLLAVASVCVAGMIALVRAEREL